MNKDVLIILSFDIYLGANQPQPEFGGKWLNIWNPLTSTSHMPTYKQIQNSLLLLPKHALVSPSFYLHLLLSSFNHILQVQLILLWSYLSKNLKIYVSDLNESHRIQRISLVTVIPNQPCNKLTSECHVIQFFYSFVVVGPTNLPHGIPHWLVTGMVLTREILFWFREICIPGCHSPRFHDIFKMST